MSEMTTELVRMKFGSHLYGTNTPTSDLDIKAVHLPTARQIVLQRVPAVISQKTKVGTGKNTQDDVDFESYSLAKYLELVTQGQTVALDMLFAPSWSFVDGHAGYLWQEIQNNKHRLITSKYMSFVGYCRQQANKYGIKGSRVAAARLALGLLTDSVNRWGTKERLSTIADLIEKMINENPEHMEFVDTEMPGGVVIRHWSVCGRKLPYSTAIKSAHEIVQKLFNEYGARALQAETNEGVDWKALSHAVRIGEQAIELLTTGNVEFPRPNADWLLRIKKGEYSYELVSGVIEGLLETILMAAEASPLRKEVDKEWVDAFIYQAYRDVVKNYG